MARKLTLNGEGRYIQGPDVGKVAYLQGHGAKIRRKPRKWPPRKGRQFVAVVVNQSFDAALWIQDESDFERCRAAGEARLVVWLEMASELLVTAEREDLKLPVSEHYAPVAHARPSGRRGE